MADFERRHLLARDGIERRPVQRRRQPHQRVAAPVLALPDDDEGRIGEVTGLGQPGATAIGEPQLGGTGVTALGDAIGKGQRRAQAGLIRVRRHRLDAQPAAELAVDAIERGRRLPPQRQTLGEIGAEAPLPGIALRGERRERQGRCRRTVPGRALDHVPEPRMQRQGREAPPVGRAAAVRIERAQRLQQRPCRRESAIRRWRQEGQTVRRAHAPERQLEHQPGQIGLLDLRRVGGGEPARLRLGPEPIGVPRAEPAGPTGPLGGARPADAARSPAGSCRCAGCSGCGAPGLCRSPPRRLRWSGWSRRCWSPRRPCAGPGSAAAPRPARPWEARRRACAPRRRGG